MKLPALILSLAVAVAVFADGSSPPDERMLPDSSLMEEMRRLVDEELLPLLDEQATPAGVPLPPPARPADSGLLLPVEFGSPPDRHDASAPARAPPSGIFVLVSFGLAPAALEALAKRALAANAVLVLRGLKNRSLRETAAAIAHVRGIAGPVPWMIDPLLFRRLGVESVPAFAAVAGEKRSVVVGDVTLDYALSRLERIGPELARKEAASARKRLRDG